MIKIIGEGNFIYFIKQLKKYIYWINVFSFFLNCSNKLNKLSFTYNFDHVLIYMMCKCYTSTTFFWFVFFFQNAECIFLPKFTLESLPCDSHGLYDIFLLSWWLLTCIQWRTAETHIFVHPPLTNMAAPRSAMLATCIALSLH